jgi:intracellular septation protein
MSKLSPKARRWVRGTVDYGGLLAFVIGYIVTRDAVQATWWLVAGSAAGLVLGFAVERRVAPMPLLAGGAALLFGGLTLIFDDARFVKMKPTFVNLAFAGFLIGGSLLNRNPLKVLMGQALVMTDRAWKTLTWRYGLYFLAIAILNEAVWRTQPEPVWVAFRFPGLQILALVFSFIQVPLIMKGMKDAEAEAGPDPESAAPTAE